MNDKRAHAQLKQINKQRNLIGVGGFRDSRRTRCEQHETFNEAMGESIKLSDAARMKSEKDK